MKKPFIYGVADRFVNMIKRIQKIVHSFEMNVMVGWIPIIAGVVLIISQLVSLYFNIALLLFTSITLLLILITYSKGWYLSAWKMGKLVLFGDIIPILLGISVIQYLRLQRDIEMGDILLPAIIIYFIAWICISLIAKSEVAKLVNEVVSIMTTIFFTAGTYIISIKYSSYSMSDALAKIIENQDLINVEIMKKNLEDELIRYMIYELASNLFILALPFLCISLFSMALISIKEYWLTKKGEKDYWSSIEDKSYIETINNEADIK